MGSIISVDFGTSNTVVAEWIEGSQASATVTLIGMSQHLPGYPPSVPSMLFVDDARNNACRVGYTVISHGLDQAQGKDAARLFRSMKRALLNPELGQEFSESGVTIDSRKAAELFLDALCEGVLATGRSITELVLTVPVMSFEIYLRWLGRAVRRFSLPEKTIPRVIDEPTAAAFGYGLDNPGGHVLVVDFGGGTLDLSLVRLPYDFEAVGRGIVINPGSSPEVTLAANRDRIKARVIAKTSKQVGGDDIDKVFVDFLLEEAGLLPWEALDDKPLLLKMAEEAKIALTDEDEYEVVTHLRSQKRTLVRAVRREEFEVKVLNSPAIAIIDKLREAVSEILMMSEQRNIGDNHIDHVLLVGGTSLIPAIRRLIGERFGSRVVLQRKPFEAVAHGALVLATSHPLDDILQHSYALEVKRETSAGEIEFDYIPIARAGTSYPFDRPVPFGDYYLKPMSDNLGSIDFVVAEIDEKPEPGRRVVYDAAGSVLTEKGKENIERAQTIRLLRNKCIVELRPPGMRSQTDRLDLRFTVDENRRLLVSVYDRLAHRMLLSNEPITRLE